jgi:hypothetical protein
MNKHFLLAFWVENSIKGILGFYHIIPFPLTRLFLLISYILPYSMINKFIFQNLKMAMS